ncbi:RIP metalloprotease RseP [candidate division TA06 bacterium]|uniref:Zinc metalloprotease n=1 Tax=candidate division TA06 bacterium TaxID=2250710 RepID=A0A933ICA2_UNCT6|nr:RIP metalloprotease RseP [candidate division TA06 bacterium]
MIITILATLFVLGVLVFVHELGHYWAARKVGIKVLKFSLGFGPKLIGFKKGDTEYLISALPLGGYVKLAGEDAFEDNYQVKPGDYMAASWWGRALMSLAGPGVNLIFAFLLFILIGFAGIRVPDFAPVVSKVQDGTAAQRMGIRPGDVIASIQGREISSWHQIQTVTDSLVKSKSADSLIVSVNREGKVSVLRASSSPGKPWHLGLEPSAQPQLGEVSSGGPAYQAGLSQGDLILALNGQPVKSWDEMRSIIYKNADKEVGLKVLRQSDTLNLKVVPLEQDLPGYGKVGMIGVAPVEFGSYKIRLGPGEAVAAGFLNTVSLVGRIYGWLAKIVSKPQNAKQLGGVLMMGQMAGPAAKKGFSDLLFLMAMFSISLMVVNLLPLPVLDGGVIFFCLLEGLRKKPLSNKVQMVIQQIGFGVIIALFSWTIFNDSMRIFNRQAALKGQGQQIEQEK